MGGRNIDPTYLAGKTKVEQLADSGWSNSKIINDGNTGLDRNQIAGIVHRHNTKKAQANNTPMPKRRAPERQVLHAEEPEVSKAGRGWKRPSAAEQRIASARAKAQSRKELIDSVVVPPITVDTSLAALAPHLYAAKPYQPGDEKEKK